MTDTKGSDFGFRPRPVLPGVAYAHDAAGWYPYQRKVFESYAPALKGSVSDPGLGVGGSVELLAVRDGLFYDAWIKIDIGTGSSAGSGFYFIDLPPELALSEVWANAGIGEAELNDSGSGICMMIRQDPGNDIVFRQHSNNTVWSSTNHPIGDNDFLIGTFKGILDYSS